MIQGPGVCPRQAWLCKLLAIFTTFHFFQLLMIGHIKPEGLSLASLASCNTLAYKVNIVENEVLWIKSLVPTSESALRCPKWLGFSQNREYLTGKYHCTIDLLLDWFGISCMTADNFCFYLPNRLIQTSQTGGQWYSDTSPFSIPWPKYKILVKAET